MSGIMLAAAARGKVLVLKLPQSEEDTGGVRRALRAAFAAVDLSLPSKTDELLAVAHLMNMPGPRQRRLRSELERRDMVEEVELGVS